MFFFRVVVVVVGWLVFRYSSAEATLSVARVSDVSERCSMQVSSTTNLNCVHTEYVHRETRVLHVTWVEEKDDVGQRSVA